MYNYKDKYLKYKSKYNARKRDNIMTGGVFEFITAYPVIQFIYFVIDTCVALLPPEGGVQLLASICVTLGMNINEDEIKEFIKSYGINELKGNIINQLKKLFYEGGKKVINEIFISIIYKT